MSEAKLISGRGIPLVGNDIDTDRIIPARYLRCVTFDGLGEQVFADDRTQTGGKHPFDLPEYKNAKILVVNGNFGCGSSREHAPQALVKWGIEAIVGESFAEIFFGNCLAMGIPCVTATPETVQQLQKTLKENPQTPMSLDLAAMEILCGELSFAVTLGEGARQMLLTGTWDSCGQLINYEPQIRKTALCLPYLHWSSQLAST
ncbi:MAG: 3-isopropylmalate dehydratase small subunit [Gomphosphaeria aponina SAG 52.96 = DSM 107014]|uniref:3-isopropylmalate dehydratase small subunit n=1 Tax=Gomphosphaeria aponina SAG 52.96 = DSM 107014 TaxID=1521640 RepID=A0A941JQ80_9CHRO|nr:3-isopropylmalate dehydratase small subunit [Gomphosphaeria aponina SAG 52.96 = DSM 107014]